MKKCLFKKSLIFINPKTKTMENYTQEQVISMIESGDNVVIDFWAEWCGPCKAFAPTFEATSNNAEFEKVKFVKVDVDTNPDICIKYGIRNIPTIILFGNKTQKAKKVGAMSKGEFQTFLNDNVAA